MKNTRVLFFAVIVSFLSCSDGDLQIETIDFDSSSIDFCEAPLANSRNILFKINDDEALILDLRSGVLNNGVIGTDTIFTESEVPSASQLTYRIFSDNITDSYFCNEIPLATPTVTEEIDAVTGMVIIKTIMNADTTAYNHIIQLSGIRLENESGESITDLTINDFGEVSTVISN